MRLLLVVGGLVILAAFLTGCVSSPRFTMAGDAISGNEAPGTFVEEGVASYYADEFNGRITSNGEVFDMHKLTAAHRTLAFNTILKVTNVTNGKSVLVRINDRGPFKDDRIIDLSLEAARQIEMIGPGTAVVKLQIIHQADSLNQKISH